MAYGSSGSSGSRTQERKCTCHAGTHESHHYSWCELKKEER